LAVTVHQVIAFALLEGIPSGVGDVISVAFGLVAFAVLALIVKGLDRL
jgi:hypothetical protein